MVRFAWFSSRTSKFQLPNPQTLSHRRSPVYNSRVTWIYNFLMLLVDAAAGGWMVRRRGAGAWFAAMCGSAAVAIVLGTLLGGMFEDGFGVIRLWSYGVFLHAPLLLAATAIVWRKKLWIAAAASIAALAILAVAADAFLVEPHWLEVTHYRLESPKIRRPLRIVVVADLQTAEFGEYERSVLRRAMQEKPDLLLLAGDYIQASPANHVQQQTKLREFLQELGADAPLGAFAVRGNVDADDWTDIFSPATSILPVDVSIASDLGDLELTCLSLADSRNPKLRLPPRDPGRFHLVLGHVPDFALGAVQADLLVAGHTHGGQVRLPGIGTLMLVNCRIPRRWAAGLTDLPGGGKLLVSRGIGMERGHAPPLRFFCRPELMVVELVPVEEGLGARD
jgi:predicted MPP superfamily phosphohydrolase